MPSCFMSSAARRQSLSARSGRRRWAIAGSLLALGLTALTPGKVWAQAGWYITPSLSASEEFDDNIFSRVKRESDFISRASPNLKAGYQSKPFSLLLSGGI